METSTEKSASYYDAAMVSPPFVAMVETPIESSLESSLPIQIRHKRNQTQIKTCGVSSDLFIQGSQQGGKSHVPRLLSMYVPLNYFPCIIFLPTSPPLLLNCKGTFGVTYSPLLFVTRPVKRSHRQPQRLDYWYSIFYGFYWYNSSRNVFVESSNAQELITRPMRCSWNRVKPLECSDESLDDDARQQLHDLAVVDNTDGRLHDRACDVQSLSFVADGVGGEAGW